MTATMTAPAAARTSTADTARAKLTAARKSLAGEMIERDEELDLALTALVAGEHLLLVGPPGTGKSMLSDAVCALLDAPRFSYLMTKFTSPEEVFGPVSLSQLKHDRYVRVTAGKLPEASVAFLDEIFKSSSAILNTLLKILNERRYDAGDGERPVPLAVCVAASNEWPTQQEGGGAELAALFDRFVLRRHVQPIRSQSGRERLWWGAGDALTVPAPLTPAELEAARAAVKALPWTKEGRGAFATIIRELAREGVQPGDRRQRKAVRIAQAAAWLAGAAAVGPEHLSVLAACLWDDPAEQMTKCAAVVAKVANPAGMAVGELSAEVEEILAAVNPSELKSATIAISKLKEVAKRLEPLKGTPKAADLLELVTAEAKRIRLAAVEAE